VSAARYRAALTNPAVTVAPEADAGHVYHLFTIRAAERDALQAHLAAAGIGTLIHYPVTVPRQQAFAHLPETSCPEADRLTSEVLSLPLHPALSDTEADDVALAIARFQHAGAGVPRR